MKHYDIAGGLRLPLDNVMKFKQICTKKPQWQQRISDKHQLMNAILKMLVNTCQLWQVLLDGCV